MSRFTLPMLSILFVVFTSGYVSTRMINSNKMVYTEQVNILQNKIGEQEIRYNLITQFSVRKLIRKFLYKIRKKFPN